MKTAGRYAVYTGIILIALGLILGFGMMFGNNDGQAETWLSIVPLGFVILLAGTVASQLSHQEKDE